MKPDSNRAESNGVNLSAALSTWEAVMQAEDSAQPSKWDGYQAVPTAPVVGSLQWQGRARGTSCELYVSRQRLAEMMGLSVRSIDRLVALGMPSETWGMRARRFRPSVAFQWAQTRAEVLA